MRTLEGVRIVGMISAVVLPFWNIPLIRHIQKRKSSADVSLPWAFGVFGCMILMLPSALMSPDPIYMTFSIINVILFGALVTQIVRFR